MLPESKNEFPKCLCLDQNIWIALARASLKQELGQRFQDSLDAIKTAIFNGTLIVPFTEGNLYETMKIAKGNRSEKRRRDLGKLFFQLTQNHTMMPYGRIRSLEMENSAAVELGLRRSFAIRTIIINKSFLPVMGAKITVTNKVNSEELPDSLINEIMLTERVTEEFFAIGSDASMYERHKQEDIEILPSLEAERLKLFGKTDEQRKVIVILELIINEPTASELILSVRKHGADYLEFLEQIKGKDKLIPYFESIPTIDVFSALQIARDIDRNRPLEANDLFDLQFYAVAIPYSNIVIGERYFSALARKEKLDSKYGTIIEADLTKVRDHLTKLGCLP